MIGSLKGSQQTLYEKAGNDFDLASLLIALLRVSGIKARYVYGEIIVPIDRVKGWFGVNDPWVAGNILATSGIPARMLLVDGRPWGIRLEHCWVEAYIPYEGSKVYRGAYDPKDIGRARWMWVPMDVSYKEYRYVEKIDVSGVSFNEDEYLDTLRDESPFDYYFKEIEGFIKDNYPDSSVFHGVSGRVIKRVYLGYIPWGYPYKRLKDTVRRFNEIPDSYRHKVRFEIMNEYGGYELSYTISCPELAGRSVSLFYTPATVSDEATIDSYGGLYNTPAYLVNLKPQLRIDNEVKAGGGAIGFGKEQVFTMVFIHPSFGGVERVENVFTSGGWYGIAFDYQRVSGELRMEHSDRLIGLLDSLDLSDTTEVIVPEAWWAEEFLYSMGLGYFSMLDVSSSLLKSFLHIVSVRELSEVITGFDVDVVYYFGMPYRVSLSGMMIDVDRDIEDGFSVYNNQDAVKSFTKVRGYEGSYWEYKIFELWLGIPSVSTVKALQIASSEGIPIYDINQSNINDILPQLNIPDEVKNEITDAVNLGLTVKVSGRTVTLNDWEGVGYILYDPETYSGDYRIYGISGGRTTEGVKKGAINGLLKMYLNQASVCAGSEYQDKTEDVEIESCIIALYVWHVLWRMKYMPFFLFPRTKQEFLKEVKREHNKVFFFAGHGAYDDLDQRSWGIVLCDREVVSIWDMEGIVMPVYRFAFINACYSADYEAAINGPDGGFVSKFLSEGKGGYWSGIENSAGRGMGIMDAVKIAKIIFDCFESGKTLAEVRNHIPRYLNYTHDPRVYLVGPDDLKLEIQ